MDDEDKRNLKQGYRYKLVFDGLHKVYTSTLNLMVSYAVEHPSEKVEAYDLQDEAKRQ